MSAEQLLGSANFGDATVIADLEAGIGTLTRLADETIDAVVVVVEPTPRSIDVARRALDVAVQHKQGRVVIVANRIMNVDDETRIREAFADHLVFLVPHDDAVVDADRRGLSALDTAPTSPAVIALTGLAAHFASG